MKRKLFFSIMFSALLSLSINAQWQDIGPGGGIVRCFVSGGTNIYAGTDGGGVFLTSNNGGLWTSVNTGLTNILVSALAINGTNIFAGTNAGVFISSNNGSSWTPVNNGLGTTLDVLAFTVSGTNIFVVTGSGGVFLSTNNGGNWTQKNTGLGNIYVNALAVN